MSELVEMVAIVTKIYAEFCVIYASKLVRLNSTDPGTELMSDRHRIYRCFIFVLHRLQFLNFIPNPRFLNTSIV